jgi:hypothetical protein
MNIVPAQFKCGWFLLILGRVIASKPMDISAIEEGVFREWAKTE